MAASDAREIVLRRVRDALAQAPPAPEPVPRSYLRTGTTDPGALVAQFLERVADYRARVHDGRAEPAATVLGALSGATALVVPADAPQGWWAGFPGSVLTDPSLAELDAPGVSVLTGCAVAIAQTGTVILDTGPAQGRRALSLVPDHHVCVVRVDQIVATVPEALARLPDPRRPLTFVSGPSATSDIELTRVEGVHGPRHLDVIVI